MNHFRSIADIRRDYGELSIEEDALVSDPLIQFQLWFEEILKQEKNDPTAMVLSTVDEQGHPDSRVVLLKGIDEGNFIFYTNYESRKGKQIESHSYAALNFYWPQMARQIRIRGKVKKITRKQSDAYFSSRPFKSQLSAIVSPQSREISHRSVLEEALNELIIHSSKGLITRPKNWGGYRVVPDEIEFWQGRDNRLHDRIRYYRQNELWSHHRLAP